MMPLLVPLNSIPSQTLNISLGGQTCLINVYQKFWGLFCDVLVNDAPIIQGVLCLNANYIVRSLYLGFIGDLAFFDNQGSSDPNYTALGDRYNLIYFFESDLPATYGLSK